MIREERLESTKEMINKYPDNIDILRVNCNYIRVILNDMLDNDKNVYVSGLGIDYTLEEEMEVYKLYKNAIHRALKKKFKEN